MTQSLIQFNVLSGLVVRGVHCLCPFSGVLCRANDLYDKMSCPNLPVPEIDSKGPPGIEPFDDPFAADVMTHETTGAIFLFMFPNPATYHIC